MIQNDVLAKFKEIFGDEGDIRVYFAPGRVNLIGEHTDYNGGHVFPCALTIGTYMAARKRTDRKLCFYSMNFDELGVIESSLDAFTPDPDGLWTNYPMGVMWAFEGRGMKLETGLDIALFGNIPNGSGLSSSASLEVVTGYMLKDLYGFDVTNQDLALIGQYSENNYNGCNCGIMDQFAVGMGKANHAIALDCASLKYEYVPLHMEGYKLVIANTNKKRGLADSKYNERRSECEQAVASISSRHPITFLCELTPTEFGQYCTSISDPIVYRRAKHAVHEHARVKQAIDALKAGKLTTFGQLMNASHRSLKDDYEVTGIELDTLAEEGQQLEGVLGSRMTGAGFGGCTVTLIQEEQVDRYIREVGKIYKDKTHLEATFYIADIGEGARKLN